MHSSATLVRPIYFVSDLHLCDARPAINALFFRFLVERAAHAKSLYILGDLFEYWVGDDQLDHDPLAREVCCALRELSAKGATTYFMHGNRDFLIGQRFAAEAALTLLIDPSELQLGQHRLLLMHGDTLCTDDIAYQQWRAQARDVRWQRELLQRSYPDRMKLASDIRAQSNSAKLAKPDDIMDASEMAIMKAFRDFNRPVLVHGHTHRPAHHFHDIDGQRCERWVLQDWYRVGGCLKFDPLSENFTLEQVA
jgi:UDP-2,3-diacylglucosamine hydrolase